MSRQMFYQLDITKKQINDLLELLETYEKLACEELPESLMDIKYQLLDVKGEEEE